MNLQFASALRDLTSGLSGQSGSVDDTRFRIIIRLLAAMAWDGAFGQMVAFFFCAPLKAPDGSRDMLREGGFSAFIPCNLYLSYRALNLLQ